MVEKQITIQDIIITIYIVEAHSRAQEKKIFIFFPADKPLSPTLNTFEVLKIFKL